MGKRRVEYVNNKDFFAAMVDFKKSVIEAENEGTARPVVPTYVAECIMKIATRLSHKPNFMNYTFRDEMICDGIENCLQYIDNFDPDKSQHPFAYFPQIIYYAFIRHIQKEKKHLYVKYKATENANIFDITAERQEHDMGDYNVDIKSGEWSEEYMHNFVENFESTRRRKRKKKNVSLTSLIESQ